MEQSKALKRILQLDFTNKLYPFKPSDRDAIRPTSCKWCGRNHFVRPVDKLEEAQLIKGRNMKGWHWIPKFFTRINHWSGLIGIIIAIVAIVLGYSQLDAILRLSGIVKVLEVSKFNPQTGGDAIIFSFLQDNLRKLKKNSSAYSLLEEKLEAIKKDYSNIVRL